MENLARRSEEHDDDEDGYEDDRLSKLPESILHNILSLLTQTDAVKTSVLSKPWRYLWTGRSTVEFFCERKCETSFLSALNNTLQRYHDQKLCIQELAVHIHNSTPESDSLMRKWIPIVVHSDIMGVKKLNLSFTKKNLYSHLSFVSESSLVENLSLKGCTLTQNSIKLKHLHTLVLDDVNISEQTLNDILPSIQDVSLVRCTGFKRIELSKNTNPTLKHFVFVNRTYGSEVEIDEDLMTTIRSIEIKQQCSLLFRGLHNESTYFSDHLTRLVLSEVKGLPNICSFDLPCLEEMRIEDCDGIDELHLSSISMKLLAVTTRNSWFKANIDAPSIQRFFYVGVVPESISFITTSKNWEESDIHIKSFSYVDMVASLWFHKLHRLLKALSQARMIWLELEHYCDKDWKRRERRKVNNEDDGGPCDDDSSVMEVEELMLLSPGEVQLCNLSFPDFLKRLFRVCRPRYIGPYHLPPFLQHVEFLREKLIEERVLVCCQQDDVLEEVSMETRLCKSDTGWEPADSSAFYQDPVEVRFPLKWRTDYSLK